MVKIIDMQFNINKNEIVVEFKLWDRLLGFVI